MVLVVEEELRGVDEVALDLVDRRGAEAAERDGYAVVADVLVRPSPESLEAGDRVEALEQPAGRRESSAS
jgi:hypothetical protein